jgi:hypothetical protein
VVVLFYGLAREREEKEGVDGEWEMKDHAMIRFAPICKIWKGIENKRITKWWW